MITIVPPNAVYHIIKFHLLHELHKYAIYFARPGLVLNFNGRAILIFFHDSATQEQSPGKWIWGTFEKNDTIWSHGD